MDSNGSFVETVYYSFTWYDPSRLFFLRLSKIKFPLFVNDRYYSFMSYLRNGIIVFFFFEI